MGFIQIHLLRSHNLGSLFDLLIHCEEYRPENTFEHRAHHQHDNHMGKYEEQHRNIVKVHVPGCIVEHYR